MKNTGSVIHMIGIDIRRGVCNKRFWIAVAVLEVVFIAVIVGGNILAVQQYYNDGVNTKSDWWGYILSAQNNFWQLTTMMLFVNFFPFLGAIAYTYSILDDRTHSYYRQITQKYGMKKYYWSRLISSGIMGGIFAVTILVILIFILEVGITYNPFLKDAVQFYKELDGNSYIYTISWGNKELASVENFAVWRLMVCASYFLIGMLYGLVTALIAFVTDNRVLVYAAPVILSMIYEKGLYAVILMFHKNPVASGTIRWFMFRERMGGFDNLIDYSVVIFLIVLMITIGKMIENNVMTRYMEGGCEE